MKCEKPRCRFDAAWMGTQTVGTRTVTMRVCDIHRLWALIIYQPRITWHPLAPQVTPISNREGGSR